MLLAMNPVIEKAAFERISRVFANPVVLGISFRKTAVINEDFLKAGSDVDYAAIDMLIDICKNGVLEKALIQGIVRRESSMLDRMSS